jgi:hypothetical protein
MSKREEISNDFIYYCKLRQFAEKEEHLSILESLAYGEKKTTRGTVVSQESFDEIVSRFTKQDDSVGADTSHHNKKSMRAPLVSMFLDRVVTQRNLKLTSSERIHMEEKIFNFISLGELSAHSLDSSVKIVTTDDGIDVIVEKKRRQKNAIARQ